MKKKREVGKEERYGKISLENDFAESTGIIWLDDVICTGKESTLTQCSKKDWGKHDCSHQEDVYITCNPETDQHRPLPGM
ncbi:hypothetical protein AB205_0097470 [Aquarana catesbeiana]|uniref:SRCR domain-containing protein n=1 Tax=Aquarana catesbeiana TaxID=8400 RepID=A0A2G9NH03_AQUCT|nr:hypothetical protein AB205_0097470 [Aquarana catesbeiana]